uniref:REJ domain-containing protein n=1 Tax=Caenorhabditis tropicalis TaxID=1561998 RepID=A0A1I7TTE5_9PELO
MERTATTPPEDVEDLQNEVDRFLAHTSTNNKSFVVRDRTGLRISFAGLLPLTTGDNGEQRIWGASIILNSGELEFPKVDYKLRVSTKKRFNPNLTCNRSKGTIKQKEVFVLTYQLPESSIESVQLTLLIDSSPHEVPLCKVPKADYYWLGKETKVPGPVQLIKERQQTSAPETESTTKFTSLGRIENVPEGLKSFLLEEDGFQSMFKLLHPFCTSLFRDLSVMRIEQLGMKEHFESGNTTDVIAEEIVRRFHEANRQKFITAPALLQ